jgi:hypothetical protein
MIFNSAEMSVIEAVKTNIQLFMNARSIFWNGITADCVIAGGYFASAFRDETFNDIDVFILNNNVAVYESLTDFGLRTTKWKIRDRDAGRYLQNPHIHGTATNMETKVQFILTDYTSRKELLDSFDYLHTTVSYVPKENKLYITRGAFDACRRKSLRVNGNNVPKQWRESKFLNRGWTAVWNNAGGADDAKTGDYNQSIQDSYNRLIQKSVADMLHSVKLPIRPGSFTISKDDLDEHGITAQTLDEAFKELIK